MTRAQIDGVARFPWLPFVQSGWRVMLPGYATTLEEVDAPLTDSDILISEVQRQFDVEAIVGDRVRVVVSSGSERAGIIVPGFVEQVTQHVARSIDVFDAVNQRIMRGNDPHTDYPGRSTDA